MKEVQKWLNWDGDGAFESVPFDLLTCFVRGFSYRPDWPRSCAAYLEQSMAWRRQHVYGDPPLIFGKGAQLPAQREYYETVFQCGPIGFDADGHPVLLERCCMTSPLEWLPRLDIETLIQNMAFNREATRACLNAQSHRLGKRVYKSCIIVDLAGLSLAHTDKRSVSAFSKINSLFSNTYPECVAKIYIVNAPLVFSVMFALLKPFLHPITVAKLEVCGGSYATVLASNGVKLFHGPCTLPTEPPSWVAAMKGLRQEMGEEKLQSGYLPPADADAMRKRGLL